MELGLQGQVAEGLALIDAAIGRARQVDDRCSIAELLRVKGELLDREPASKDQAEAQFIEAVEASRQQESLAWKLRCAMSLARAWLQQGRRVEARELLAPVYAQFTEGFDTADLQQARALLGSMR
jgi:predicted ATPase